MVVVVTVIRDICSPVLHFKHHHTKQYVLSKTGTTHHILPPQKLRQQSQKSLKSDVVVIVVIVIAADAIRRIYKALHFKTPRYTDKTKSHRNCLQQ